MAGKPKSLSKSGHRQVKNLGKRIKELRKKSGYTSYDTLAHEHSIVRSQYGKYEQGVDMKFSTILKLAEIHGLTLKEFFAEGFE